MHDGRITVWLPAIRTGSGAEIFVSRLSDALHRKGITAQITWFPLWYEFFPFLLRNVSPPIGTDIIFANSWNGFAFKREGLPLVTILHHSAFDPACRRYLGLAQRIYHHVLIRPYERRSFHRADVITAVSRFAAASMQRATGIPDVETIHNWVDVHRFRPQSPPSDQPARPFRLLFVGNVSPMKGGNLLEPLMKLLGDDFLLHIAGRESPRQVYPPNIKSLGWLDEPALIRAYQDCDALICPSRSEGFGYTALEAMACGKPVIASKATALPEVIADNVSGILCPIDDLTEFANACRRLANDHVLRNEMGLAARQRAVEKFSEDAIVPHYVALIRRLAKS